MIPVRHPLNLFEENPYCGDSLEAAKEHYTNGTFTMWEVNARNLIAEIGGVIAVQEEWALRDAIGIAYVPYNRLEYNPNWATYNNRGDPLGVLLGGDGQFAIAATEDDAYIGALNPGEAREEVYHFSLVVAYGVDKKYFRDTSYGATNYNHRPYDEDDPEQKHCEVLGEYYTYTFFKDQRNALWNRYDRTLTSAELAAQGGWPDWARGNDRSDHFDDWITGYPPYGCN